MGLESGLDDFSPGGTVGKTPADAWRKKLSELAVIAEAVAEGVIAGVDIGNRARRCGAGETSDLGNAEISDNHDSSLPRIIMRLG